MDHIISYENCFSDLQSALGLLNKRGCIADKEPVAKAFQNKQFLGIVSGGYQKDLKNERWIGLLINENLDFVAASEPNGTFFYLQEKLTVKEVQKLKEVLMSVLAGSYGLLAHYDNSYSNKYPFREIVRDNQAEAYRKVSANGSIEEGISILLDTDLPTKLLVEVCSEGNYKVYMLSPVSQGQVYFGGRFGS